MGKMTDWEAIRLDYCAGELSIQGVADKHGIAKTTLIDAAKKHGWERQKAPSKAPDQNKNGRSDGRKNGRMVGASNGGACSDPTGPEKCAKTPKTKRNSRQHGRMVGRSGNPSPANQFSPQNRASLKHGGYARRLLTSDANLEDAAALTLEDELLRVRAANLEAAENIGRWKTQLVDAKGDMIDVLMKRIEDAHRAMDRNTSRMESLTTGLTLGRKAEADTLLKLAARDKALFELQRERGLEHLESERRELVNKKIQAEIDRADPASEDNVVVVHDSLLVPGSVH